MAIDKTIWLLIAQEDKNAYSRLYRQLFPKLYNYGAKFTGEHIILEDAIQETLLLVWDKRPTLPSMDYPETYFFSVFRNLLFARLKKHSQHQIGLREESEPVFNVEQIIIKNETDSEIKTKLKQSLKELTDRQREVIFLRFYEGFSYDQVAAVLGITTKATYKAVARALARLKEVMLIFLFLLYS